MHRIFCAALCGIVAAAPATYAQAVQGQPFAPPARNPPKIVQTNNAPLVAYPVSASGTTPASAPPAAAQAGEIDTSLPAATPQCKLHDDAVQGADGTKRIVLGCDN